MGTRETRPEIEKKEKEHLFKKDPSEYDDKELLYQFNAMHDLYAKKETSGRAAWMGKAWSFEDIINYYVLLVKEMAKRGLKPVRSSVLDDVTTSLFGWGIWGGENDGSSVPEVEPSKSAIEDDKDREDLCKRCGQCCYLIKNGQPTDTPCEFLEFLEDGTTKCKIYKERLGTIIGSNNICGPRSSSPFDYEGCPYNSGKPLVRNHCFVD